MTEQLRLCPFCGGEFRIGQEPDDNHPVAGMFYIFHRREDGRPWACRIEVRGHFETAEQAARFWNGRSEHEALRKIADLRLATDQGSLRVRADLMWQIATDALQTATPTPSEKGEKL